MITLLKDGLSTHGRKREATSNVYVVDKMICLKRSVIMTDYKCEVAEKDL